MRCTWSLNQTLWTPLGTCSLLQAQQPLSLAAPSCLLFELGTLTLTLRTWGTLCAGATVNVGIDASKVVITKLKLDKDRKVRDPSTAPHPPTFGVFEC